MLWPLGILSSSRSPPFSFLVSPPTNCVAIPLPFFTREKNVFHRACCVRVVPLRDSDNLPNPCCREIYLVGSISSTHQPDCSLLLFIASVGFPCAIKKTHRVHSYQCQRSSFLAKRGLLKPEIQMGRSSEGI